MPTYEYHCSKCQHQFELVQSMSAAALETCPKDQCPRKPWGKGKVKRAIGGGAGLIFKGSGFYITDYRSEGYQKAARQESSAGESKPASSDTKAGGGESKSSSKDTKPAAKSEAKPTKKA